MSVLGRATAVARDGQRGSSGNPSIRQRFPQLTLLHRPVRRAPRTPFAVLLVIIAGLGLVGLLLINTQLQQGAVEISRIDRENQILRERVQTLTQSVAAAAAPQRLAARAHELGMVPNPRPAFLRISDGTVLGDPKVAEAPPSPPPQPAPVAAQLPAAATPAPPGPEAPTSAPEQHAAPTAEPAAPGQQAAPTAEPAPGHAPAQAPASPPDQPVAPAAEVPQ